MAPRPRKKKRVTITDVALEAKVSIAAVSRILNNNYDGFSAREETKERVLLAAKTLGYRPSRAAISLATGRHNAIALCFPTHELDAQPIAVGSIDQVFRHFEMMLVINGIRRAIEPERLDLILVPARPEHRTDEFVLSLQDKVDGVLWINPDDEGETLNEIVQAGLALAVVGSAPIAGNFVNVRADEATAGRMGMGHLLVRGAKKLLIAVPTERANEVGIKERIEGAKRAIADYSKKDLDLKIVQLPIEPNRARIVLAEHLDKAGIPDGILTMGGALAVRDFARAVSQKLRRPERHAARRLRGKPAVHGKLTIDHGPALSDRTDVPRGSAVAPRVHRHRRGARCRVEDPTAHRARVLPVKLRSAF
jgi:DNA-binding LacI/PurR family transcriptional regulator